ncbi:MAG: energy transducer TonB [Verrucomicrobiota bacterium]
MSKGATYTLNVITLAAWLSAVLGACIGFSVHQEWTVKFAKKPKPLSVITKIEIAASEAIETAETVLTEQIPTETIVEPAIPELSAPPALPELAPMAELPEIPEIPEVVIQKTAQKVATPPTPNTNSNPTARPKPNQATKPNNTPPSSATLLSFGKGEGRQPSPSYPLQAKRQNQQGTVIVEFLVGAEGKVLNAWLKSPSPYELLNNSALSTVRNRWRFPAGSARHYRISIIFQLN